MYQLPSEKKIVGVSYNGPIQDVGAAQSKAMPSHARYRYVQPITYNTEDGSEFSSTLTALTKPKLNERFNRQVRYAVDGQLFAALREGQLVGTITRMSLSFGT